MNMIEQLETLRNSLITRTRQNGTRYVALADDAPEWVSALVYELHDDGRILPDDAIYADLARVADELADLWTEDSDPSDLASEVADGLMSIYDSDLMDWIRNPWAREWVDSAIEEHGCQENLAKTIAFGQYCWFEHVLRSILGRVESLSS